MFADIGWTFIALPYTGYTGQSYIPDAEELKKRRLQTSS
jgi:hypothetical protein